MKISEAVKKLQEIKAKRGDLPVYITDHWDSTEFEEEIYEDSFKVRDRKNYSKEDKILLYPRRLTLA